MAGPLYANNVAALLATTAGPSDVLLQLGPGQGAKFPALSGGNWYYVTLVHNTTGVVEIVKATGKSGDVLTVQRGQDATTATSFPVGSVVEMRLVAQMLRELDFRTFFGTASGLATLDSTVHLTQSQIPVNIPLLTAGKLDIAVIPDAVALDSEVALKANKAGDTFTGPVTIAPTLDLISAPFKVQGAFTLAGRQILLTNTSTAVDSAFGFLIKSGTSLGTSIGDGAPEYTGVPEYAKRFFIENANVNGGIAYSAIGASGSHNWHVGAAPARPLIMQLSNIGLGVTGVISATGTITAGGVLTGNSIVTALYVSSNTPDLVLATGAAGHIYLRPNGLGLATSEAALDSAGLFTAIDIQATSDRELKDSLGRLNFREDLADQIELWSWIWKGTGAAGRGPVAQEVQAYAPEFVGKGASGYLSIDKAGLALATLPGIAARLRRLEAALNFEVQPCSPVN